jgi:hypothetical protein
LDCGEGLVFEWWVRFDFGGLENLDSSARDNKRVISTTPINFINVNLLCHRSDDQRQHGYPSTTIERHVFDFIFAVAIVGCHFWLPMAKAERGGDDGFDAARSSICNGDKESSITFM